MKLRIKRLKKFFNRANPFKAPKYESPREAVLVRRLRKRQAGEGFASAVKESYE